MKKLISFIAMFAMSISLASVSYAAEAPSISAELVDVPETLEVGSTFQLKIKYSNVPTSENEVDWAGVGIQLVQFDMSIPGYGEYLTKNGKSYQTDSLGTACGTLATKNLDSTGLLKYVVAPGATADSVYRVGSSDVYILNLKVLKVPETDLNFNFGDTTMIKTAEYNSSDAKISDTIYRESDSTLKVSNTVLKAPVAETTKYTVTYKVDDTQYGDPVEVEEGKTVAALPTAPTKEGYTFTGWVIEGTETAFTAETTINTNTTVVAVFTKNEEKYGTPIGGVEGDPYYGKSLYINEGETTFNFGTDKGIEITKTVGETSEKKVFGVKYLYDKGIEVEKGGDATATFTIGVIDVSGLAKGTFSFRVLQSLAGIE